MQTFVRGARLAAVLGGGAGDLGLRQQCRRRRAGATRRPATPGSQQDFVVNVGDRVFFETDSTELTPQSRATLDKQAQWLHQLRAVQPVHHRRPRRRARHARIQHRARRPPRADRARLSDLARHRGQPHAHDLLRQGTAGRGLQRHFLLVAEPPRGHGAQRQFVRASVCRCSKRVMARLSAGHRRHLRCRIQARDGRRPGSVTISTQPALC